LTLRRHPLALLRERLQRRRIQSAQQLGDLKTQTHVRTAGLVLVRQSPGTAHNTTFMTLEDETGVVNVIVWGSIAEKYRQPFLQAQLLEVGGRLQHEKGVMHVIAEDLVDRSAWLGSLRAPARWDLSWQLQLEIEDGEVARGIVTSVDAAGAWFHEQVLVHYPDSVYAQTATGKVRRIEGLLRCHLSAVNILAVLWCSKSQISASRRIGGDARGSR
jgi:hypothetical protein